MKKTARVMIPERVPISKRFLGADNRTRYGHWENDTVVSRKGCSGGLSVGCERKARLVVAQKVTSMSTSEHMEAIQKQISSYKTLSITFDNGTENKQHQSLSIPTFFCEPYSSWQKGGVENMNSLLRQYLPRKTDLQTVSDGQLRDIQERLNNRPRKGLNYQTPNEKLREYLKVAH